MRWTSKKTTVTLITSTFAQASKSIFTQTGGIACRRSKLQQGQQQQLGRKLKTIMHTSWTQWQVCTCWFSTQASLNRDHKTTELRWTLTEYEYAEQLPSSLIQADLPCEITARIAEAYTPRTAPQERWANGSLVELARLCRSCTPQHHWKTCIDWLHAALTCKEATSDSKQECCWACG